MGLIGYAAGRGGIRGREWRKTLLIRPPNLEWVWVPCNSRHLGRESTPKENRTVLQDVMSLPTGVGSDMVSPEFETD